MSGLVERETFEYGNTQLFIDKHADGSRTYWVQVGMAALQLRPIEVMDVTILLNALIKDDEMMDEMQVGNLVPLADGWFREVTTGRVFKMDEDGHLVFPFDEDGVMVHMPDDDDDDERPSNHFRDGWLDEKEG